MNHGQTEMFECQPAPPGCALSVHSISHMNPNEGDHTLLKTRGRQRMP